ncbi:MAG: alpha-glucan family phosphorylase [Actinomycetota bacterium]|nr:alpha-glucan family phosphorylase [Actinomycetota bacterium]
MKALQSFTVRPRLPAQLDGLATLAMNLRWSWDRRTRALFEWVDPEVWSAAAQDPVRVLGEVSRQRFDELAADVRFLRTLDESLERFATYCEGDRWFQERKDSPLRHIAYFSPEFGISEALPQYSGGLGILAGDHLKAASDLGVPLVGIGLFYRHGYFRQSLSVDGWQQERFPDLDPYAMALTLTDARVQLDMGGTDVTAQVWRADVGRVPLYLLDTDIEDNAPSVRTITDRLYGGDIEHRLRQEILLGVGGVRALRELGMPTQVFHTNEGHAGFLGLERIRELIVHGGLTYPEAIEAARSGCLFTTHTPVPAGIDKFPRELMDKYFSRWASECGVKVDDLMALGHRPGEATADRFNMAVMGLRLAARSNGVAKLHGSVSRAMFSDLWPDVPEAEVPITSVTNGVHGSTWVTAENAELLARHLGEEWEASSDWSRVSSIGADEIWSARRVGTERLVRFVRDHLHSAGLQRGFSPSDVAWTGQALDPDALTICFARRFATYKRATLLLSQPSRLKKLLLDADRPVQFVFAGKAHPADDKGKELIRQIVEFSHDMGIRHRFVFLDDYDMAVARALYGGADVWLNNPRRPMEACGTSGMKAALNGALNCSILDGWWDEMFNGENGWAITSADTVEDDWQRDELEANSLFDLLESQIVPLFYDRSANTLPLAWIERMKANWRSLGPQVTAHRMVRDYTTELYEPIAGRADHLTAGGNLAARELAAWKQRIGEAWHGVHIDQTEPDITVSDLGSVQQVTARVSLGHLEPTDVEVQLVHGPVGQHDEIEHAETVVMSRKEKVGDGHWMYTASFACDRAGRYGFTVRIVPGHADLSQPLELGRIAWAN